MVKKSNNKNLSVKEFYAKIKALEENKNVIFEVQVTNQFKKSVNLSYFRNFDLHLLFEIVEILAQDKTLPEKNFAHKLKGQYVGIWECHIKPDWVLMWQKDKDSLILLLLNTATHSDFMDKRKK
ncbi:MAG: type II toxin-antitoxin system YafQ family toxin [Marinilabiliaceae bacterium]|nr:type II toxin-antitoxin system YafQ family toxin [Marinilabiliaceae bacterium]